MSLIFKMRRGSRTTMGSTKANLVLESGEMFLEYPDDRIGTGPCRIKVGDGATEYSALPYALSITNIKKNGTIINPAADGTVDVVVPTKTSQLTNDSGFKTTDNNTTYGIGVAANSAANGAVAIRLSGSNGVNDDQIIKGTGATTVTTDSAGNIIINSTNTVYSHPNSGVTAGTYRSVNVNAQGHVTGGSNPTTLAGYGITDAAAKAHTHGNGNITGLDASKLTGTIDIARLPQGALERCAVVADDTARFKLTTATVQLGDTVKVTATGKMYFVIDASKLSTEAGYEVYTAGSATSVPWSGITGKPSSFTPSAHNQAISTITGLQAILDGKVTGVTLSGTRITVTTVSGNSSFSLGAAALKAISDSTAAQAIGTGANLTTERDVYYGLPKINGGHSYTSNNNYYAPTGAGSAGQVLKSNGSGAPGWVSFQSLIDSASFDFGDEG